LGKEVKVELEGAETELDKVLVERLDDPLLHLVRNAIDHGIEPPEVRERAGKPRVGTLRLIARQRGGSILVAIRDDGAGMSPKRLKARAIERGLVSEAEAAAMSERDAYDLIFRAGFSTATVISDVSGRGVGMDVVRDAVASLKGTVAIESQEGLGATVELRLPLTLAITQILAVRVSGEVVAIPLDAVLSARAVALAELEVVAASATLRVGKRLVPIIDLARLLGLEPPGELAHDLVSAYVVVVDTGGELYGLLVQQLLGRHEVVIKSLGVLLAGAPFAAGATLVDDRVLVVLDLTAVAGAAARGGDYGAVASAASPAPQMAARGQKVLVAEDSFAVREALRRAFEQRGFEVVTAADGAEALERARATSFDAVSTDIVMPNVDGYELTRALRADARYGAVPIVMLTSKDARLDELRGLDSGADAYLTKPVDATDVVREIEALLARARRPG
jgi:two-component system chemotaxis sensor kinase CheA